MTTIQAVKQRLGFKLPQELDLSLILRGLFASSVVFWHTLGFQLGSHPALNVPGRVSVWMFFGISGYVISHGFFSSRVSFDFLGLRYYFSRRAARILPLFWLASICAVLLLLVRGDQIPFGASEILQQIFALQWVHQYALNGVFWTLGIELQFYLIAPLLILALLRGGRVGVYVGVIIVALFWFAPWSVGDNRTLLGGLPHFLTGAILAKVSFSSSFQRFIRRRYAPLALGTAAVAFLGLTNTLYNLDQVSFWNGTGALLTDLTMALFLALHCGLAARKIKPNSLATLGHVVGVLSYGIYVWHGFLLHYFSYLESKFLYVYLASVCLAWLSFTLLERPILGLAKSTARLNPAKRSPEL